MQQKQSKGKTPIPQKSKIPSVQDKKQILSPTKQKSLPTQQPKSSIIKPLQKPSLIMNSSTNTASKQSPQIPPQTIQNNKQITKVQNVAPKKPQEIVKPNPKSYQKQYFIPILKSKYLTIYLLQTMFKFQHQVVLFLRSICKGSEYFLETFYESEIKQYFQVYEIDIKIPLISDIVKSGIHHTDERPMLLKKLSGFNNLNNIYEFQECFRLSMQIIINKLQSGQHSIDPEAQSFCFSLIKKYMDKLKKVKFIANEDSVSNSQKKKFLVSDLQQDRIYSFFFQMNNIFEERETIGATEIEFQDIDQKYINIFIGYFFYKDKKSNEEFIRKINVQSESPQKKQKITKDEDGIDSINFLMEKNQLDILEEIEKNKVAIPFSQFRLESLKIQNCFLDEQNYRQLTSFFMYCVNLQELDLTAILQYRSDQQIPIDFIQCMKNFVNLGSNAKYNLKSLGLSNNFFGDETLKILIVEVFQKLKNLQSIDISANKLSDSGIQSFFFDFVHKNDSLKSLKLNYNKFKNIKTAQCIAESVSQCNNIEQMSLKMCGITYDLFQELIKPSQTQVAAKADKKGVFSFLTQKLKVLDLCSNKIGNKGLILLRDQLQYQLLNKSEITNLSLYDNGLEGIEAVDMLKNIIQNNLKNLQFINIQSNLISMLDIMALQSIINKLNIEQSRQIQIKV